MTTWATIPYRDKPELTGPLLKQLADEDALEGVILLDHASTHATYSEIRELIRRECRLHYVLHRFAPDVTLTRMWNSAWETAEDLKVDALAYLNNDISIPTGFIGALTEALRSDDQMWAVSADWHLGPGHPLRPAGVRYVSGSQRHGGMCGWAFMVRVAARAEGLPPIDEQFQWWCGDDDLAFAIEAAGRKVGLAQGVPVDHQRSQTLITRPELTQVCNEDLGRCITKWRR